MCRLEYGLYRRGGGGGGDGGEAPGAPWCSVLTPAMIQVLEYDEDLRYYWTAGYGGDDVSYTPACTLIGDLLRHLVYIRPDTIIEIVIHRKDSSNNRQK